jgi:hypothetical protein
MAELAPTEAMTREDAIAAITPTGRTREQAEAFLDIVGSAFRRRGWADGEPLTEDEIAANINTLIGEAP